MTNSCDFCESDGGEALYRNAQLRVIAVGGDEGERFEGFCRVIWNAHVRELTDLTESERLYLMRVVFLVEAALRAALQPHKMNVASLGNLTPHVHWHVIPRFADDAAFPKPIWAVTPNSDNTDVVNRATTSQKRDPSARWKDAVRRELSTLEG